MRMPPFMKRIALMPFGLSRSCSPLRDVVLEAERAADDLVRGRLVDAALAVGARVDARDVARRRNEDVALVRVVDLDPREVVRAVLRVARLRELVDAARDRLGRVEDREAVLARLAVREQRVLNGRRGLAGSREDRDLVDLLEALQAGARTGATVAADVERVTTATADGRRWRLLVLLVACRRPWPRPWRLSGAPTLTTKQREPPLLKKP